MATPTEFPEANFLWKGWSKNEDREEVVDLPAYRDDLQTISCWKLSWRERWLAIWTGKVWVHVTGQQQPIYISTESPFPVRD